MYVHAYVGTYIYVCTYVYVYVLQGVCVCKVCSMYVYCVLSDCASVIVLHFGSSMYS